MKDPSGLPTALELIVDPQADHSGGDSILYHAADWPMSEANATLIASAPDLLKALENLVEKCLHSDEYKQKVDELYNAQQAIKKARGL